MDYEAQTVLYLLAGILGLGIILSVRRGLLSPLFLFFTYLMVGIVLRAYYINDFFEPDDLDFWATTLPVVKEGMNAALVEIVIILLVTIPVFLFINRLKDSRLTYKV